MRRLLIVMAMASCSKPASVECGKGTVLRNGTCEIAETAKVASTPPPPDAAIAGEAAVPAEVAATGWTYATKQDAMRGTSTETATIMSSVAGDARLGVLLRHEPKGAAQPGDAVLFISEAVQFDCHGYGCIALAKFDDEKPMEIFVEPASGTAHAVLLTDHQIPGLLTKMKSAKTMLVELPIWSAGKRQFSFDVAGLKWEHAEKPPAATSNARPLAAATGSFSCQTEGEGGKCTRIDEPCGKSLDPSCRANAWCYRLIDRTELCWASQAICVQFRQIAGTDAGDCVKR